MSHSELDEHPRGGCITLVEIRNKERRLISADGRNVIEIASVVRERRQPNALHVVSEILVCCSHVTCFGRSTRAYEKRLKEGVIRDVLPLLCLKANETHRPQTFSHPSPSRSNLPAVD